MPHVQVGEILQDIKGPQIMKQVSNAIWMELIIVICFKMENVVHPFKYSKNISKILWREISTLRIMKRVIKPSKKLGYIVIQYVWKKNYVEEYNWFIRYDYSYEGSLNASPGATIIIRIISYIVCYKSEYS